jgi:hypothetical protein
VIDRVVGWILTVAVVLPPEVFVLCEDLLKALIPTITRTARITITQILFIAVSPFPIGGVIAGRPSYDLNRRAGPAERQQDGGDEEQAAQNP